MIMKLRPETMKKYKNLTRPILLRVAKKRTFITYEELMAQMGGRPGRGYIGEVLGEVSDSEHGNRRPLLSSLVVNKKDGLPGNLYYKLKAFPSSLINAPRESKIARWQKEYWKTLKKYAP
jgi:hypothetical protein